MEHRMILIGCLPAGSMNCLCNQDLSIGSFKGLKGSKNVLNRKREWKKEDVKHQLWKVTTLYYLFLSFLAPLGGLLGWVRDDIKWVYLQAGNLTWSNNTPEIVVHAFILTEALSECNFLKS